MGNVFICVIVSKLSVYNSSLSQYTIYFMQIYMKTFWCIYCGACIQLLGAKRALLSLSLALIAA